MKTRFMITHRPEPLNPQASVLGKAGLMENRSLISRTAWEAYRSGAYEVCDALLARYEAQRPLSLELLKLQGWSLIAQGRPEEAVRTLDGATASGHDSQIVYQLAYAHAQLDCHEQVVVLVDDRIMQDVPEAIALKMRALQRVGRLDDSIELGMRFQAHATREREICGVLANVLIDAGRYNEARQFVERAQGTADGCTASGLLALDRQDRQRALLFFRQAASLNPQSGRARLGEGLCLLDCENHAAAAPCFDQAATLLEHADAWAVAAWTHLLHEGTSHARLRFERACHVDRGFAEARGGLAIVCLHEGKFEEAEVHAAQSLQLSRDCLSGTLAHSHLLARAGDFAAAQQVRQSIACHPLGRDGLSIAKGLARRAIRHANPY